MIETLKRKILCRLRAKRIKNLCAQKNKCRMHHEHHAGHISFANALHNRRSGNYGHHTGRMKNIVAGKNGWACCGGDLPEAALQLGKAKKGVYKFLCVKCDGHLVHKLLEMGFIPGDDIKVVSNMGSNGSVMIEVKGSKLVLSNKIADNIFVTEKKVYEFK